METLREPKQHTAIEPAKRWRNVYEKTGSFIQVLVKPGNFEFPLGLAISKPGPFPAQTVWPSKEIAEQKALDFLAKETWNNRSPYGLDDILTYKDSVPEE